MPKSRTKTDSDQAQAGSSGRFYGALAKLSPGEPMAVRRRTVLGLVQVIYDQLQDIAARRADGIDLHPTTFQIMILLALGGDDGVLPASQIQRALGFTPGGITRRLDTMTALGLAERVRDPEDGRAWLVRLTAHGRQLVMGPIEDNREINRKIEESFSEVEWTLLIALLQRLAGTLAEGRP